MAIVSGRGAPVGQKSVPDLLFGCGYLGLVAGLFCYRCGRNYIEMARSAVANRSVLLAIGVLAMSLFIVILMMAITEHALELIRRRHPARRRA